jgi:predicted DNA-binding WGR domain protein
MLERRGPAQSAVSCSLSSRLVRDWGRIGSNGQELVEVFADELAASLALEAVAAAKRWRGYRNL